MRRVLGALIGIAVLGAVSFLGGIALYNSPGPLSVATAVVVPRGGLDGIAEALGAAHVIRTGPVFPIAVALTRQAGPPRAGEFEFPAQVSLRQVLAILRTARTVQHRLTVAEGLTALQVGGLLTQATTLDGPTPELIEGSFLPETYIFERGTARALIANRGHVAMDRALDQAWQGRSRGLPITTPAELLTLASIIERETARPDERSHIAAAFHNRLRRGMKLQSDPTTIYATSRTGVLDHPLTRAELDRDDPYNTYRAPGLPPGPICMPGVASLMAAAHPDDSADLYFVADGTGGHAFAATQEAHLRNVARWREIERTRPR